MPVTYASTGQKGLTFKGTMKSSHLPNKPIGEKIDIEGILYSVTVSDTDTVYFLAPKIDFLSIVFPVNDMDAQQGIVNLLVGLVKDDGEPEFEDAIKPFAPGYGQNISLTDPKSGARILIQAKPV